MLVTCVSCAGHMHWEILLESHLRLTCGHMHRETCVLQYSPDGSRQYMQPNVSFLYLMEMEKERNISMRQSTGFGADRML